MRSAPHLLLLALIGLQTGCDVTVPTLSRTEGALLYGEDDREEPLGTYLEVARHSTVALVPPELLEETPDGVRSLALSLGDALPLCEGERFLAQPQLAACSGVLVSPDVVLTAGHCFRGRDDCGRFAYVVGFQGIESAEGLTLARENVLGCRRLLAWSVPPSTEAKAEDYAFVQLDRPVPGGRPVSVARTQLTGADPLTLLGHPLGLPTKLERSVPVLATHADYVLAAADTYIGSSGSPAFDAEGRLRGILVAGVQDFEEVDGCWASRTLDEPSGSEVLASVQVAHAALCERTPLEPTLCGAQAGCGDGFCSVGEPERCARDCPPPRCTGLDCPGARYVTPSAAPPTEDAEHGCAARSQRASAPPAWVVALIALGVTRRRASRPTGAAPSGSRAVLSGGIEEANAVGPAGRIGYLAKPLRRSGRRARSFASAPQRTVPATTRKTRDGAWQ